MNIFYSETDDTAHPDPILRCRATCPTLGGARCQSRAGLNGFCRVHEGPTVGTPGTARRRHLPAADAANGSTAPDACALPWQVLMWKIKTIRRLFDLGATPTEARWVMNDLPVPAMAAALSQEALAMIDILERNMPEQLAADRKAEAEYAPLARDMGDGVVDDRNATPSDTATPPVDPGDGEPDGSVDTIGQWDVPTDLPRPAGRPAPVHASGRPERRHQGRVPAPRRERGDTTGPTGRRRRDMWADAPADRARPRAPGETPRAIFAMLPHVCRETALVSRPDRMAAEAGPTRRNNPNQSSGLVALWWKIVGHDHLPGREPPVERITPNHGSALLFHKVRRHGEAGARHFVIATDRTHAMAEVPVGFAQCRIAPPFGRARSGGDHWTGAYPADNLGRDSRRSNHAAR